VFGKRKDRKLSQCARIGKKESTEKADATKKSMMILQSVRGSSKQSTSGTRLQREKNEEETSKAGRHPRNQSYRGVSSYNARTEKRKDKSVDIVVNKKRKGERKQLQKSLWGVTRDGRKQFSSKKKTFGERSASAKDEGNAPRRVRWGFEGFE